MSVRSNGWDKAEAIESRPITRQIGARERYASVKALDARPSTLDNSPS
jgi:hypothetical protein